MTRLTFFQHFEINIVRALSDQLVEAFCGLAPAPLDSKNVGMLKAGQGVYQLYLTERLVYVGKAKSLQSRLSQHLKKISGRRILKLDDMKFACLYIHRNWTALAPETSLINHYKALDDYSCEWNGNGFGPHDPGRRRETTDVAPDGFDSKYPINADYLIGDIEAGRWKVIDLLIHLKTGLPFLLRYQLGEKKSWKIGHPDFHRYFVDVGQGPVSAQTLLRDIAKILPGWQATVFPSHMILYKENTVYKHGTTIWPES